MRHGKHEGDTAIAPIHPPGKASADLRTEAEALLAAGFPIRLVLEMAKRAAATGASIEDEMLAAGIDEDLYFSRLATFLGVDFLARPEPGTVIDGADLDTQLIDPEMLRLHPPGRAPVIASVPKARRLFELQQLLAGLGKARASLAITSRTAVRRCVWEAGARRRVKDAVSNLFDATPHFSARVTFSGLQGLVAGTALSTLAFAMLTIPALASLWLHATVSMFYAASLGMRAAALALNRRRHEPTPVPRPSGPVPVYTVMVALYRE